MNSELLKKLKHYRLSEEEYKKIILLMGRELKPIEWPLFSALWSEHCSYKSSRIHLKKLFTTHPRVLQGPGENAGVIDLGLGERLAFKMESHNHPSFIEPTQGAATGVGGILRDIFTMGARPIASMNYLCFGSSEDKDSPRLLHGVVKGISSYGNCVGVPTVNGQTTFHESYNQNNLVNAFSAGLFRPGEEIFYGKASGPGNLIVYAGAATGRDGVHGAAMASESFDSDVEKKKPNVQIGDPFFEKLLIEACLEVMRDGLVVGLQDMGAAGLTSSTFEMASRAQTGLKIDLKKVPLREPDITAEEILLSESQERMVLIVEPEKLEKVISVFKRWDLECTQIGEITSGHLVELFWGQDKLTEISHIPLVEEAPKYNRPFKLPESAPSEKIQMSEILNLKKEIYSFLSHSQMTSREWITNQYDQRVGAKTISACDDSVAQLRLPDSGRVLTLATGCRPLLMEWDVRVGSMDSIATPALQMAVKGAKALAVTDCLNFGNPEKEKVMGQFVASLESMNEACLILETPIVSGNVSLYNETLGENIIPTPATGLVGIREKITFPKSYFSREGLEIWLVKMNDEKLWLGEYAKIMEKKKSRGEGYMDLREVSKFQKCLLDLAPYAEASQLVSRGGLVRTLAKMSFNPNGSNMGSKIQIEENKRSLQESLFCERFYCALYATDKMQTPHFLKILEEHKSHVEFIKIGITQGTEMVLNQLEINLDDLKAAQNKGLKHIVENFL